MPATTGPIFNMATTLATDGVLSPRPQPSFVALVILDHGAVVAGSGAQIAGHRADVIRNARPLAIRNA